MDVAVHETGRGHEARGVYDSRVGSDAVLGGVAVHAEVGDATILDGDVAVGQNLLRCHADDIGVPDHEVCELITSGDADEVFVAFPERLLAELVEHRTPPSVACSFSR